MGRGIYIVGVSCLGAVAFRVTCWHIAYLTRVKANALGKGLEASIYIGTESMHLLLAQAHWLNRLHVWVALLRHT